MCDNAIEGFHLSFRPMYRQSFENITAALLPACLSVYGDRLKSVALFGSVARGTMRPDSDIDVLLVVDDLPNGPRNRLLEFERVEAALDPLLAEARAAGVHTDVCPIFKTPDELIRGSLLYLDMTDQALILHDPTGLLRNYLDDLTHRLQAMGARRVYKGGSYYWLLKPDFRPGDRIEL